jgi:hypothetical protein
MPDVGLDPRERNLTLCLDESKVYEKKSRIHHLSGEIHTIYPYVFMNPELVNELYRLHDDFVLVSADKASRNIVLVFKNYYYECLLDKLGFTSTCGNPTYTPTNLTRDEILQNYFSVLNTFKISKNRYHFELPYLYWIPKLHKYPYQQRYIAGSSKCSTTPLCLLLTKLLTAIKESLQRYYSTAYSRSGINQMWILKNFKELLENLKSQCFFLKLTLPKHMISPHAIQQFLITN